MTTPSELVVWGTGDEPDTLAAARRAFTVARDPDDVPDRRQGEEGEGRLFVVGRKQAAGFVAFCFWKIFG